ncbi:MAG: hypothetical protein A2X20_00180 [Bacteroidetes bacterium GWE2_40_15]|nr:MAG: hypothetical protein A2X20_00180 [Bacteroidetes bacterium GWE2_40_15]
MKLTMILLVVAFLQVQAKGYSQMITLNQQNAQLEDVFVEIMKQTNSKFVYSSTMLKVANPVNINLTNVTLDEALELCFEGQPLTYIIDEDNTVIVKMKELPPPPVKGVVMDEQGNLFAFVNVMVKGTTTGTFTDEKGNFTINAAKGSILVFSFVGYQTLEVTVGDGPINVVLKGGINVLDEVQIIGYGTTTKRENTGAISSVKAKDLSKQPVSNFALALQGKMTGIVVNNSEGVGSSVDIVIRGLNSFGSGTRPLFIVDGVIINAANTNAVYSSYVHGTSPLGALNPNDIASIDILKDADATAIYGSRATNGVVLITTKKAELGKTRVNLDMYTGFNKATYMPKLLNTEQYVAMRKEGFTLDNRVPTESRAADLTNLSPWKENAYTDWTKYEFGNNAPIMNANIDMSGGTKGLSYYFSTGYLKQYDIQPGNPYQERISSRLNLSSISMNDRLESTLSVQYSADKLKPTQVATNIVGGVRFLPPNYPLYTDQGDFYWGSSTSFNFANPEASMTQKVSYLSSNLLMSADFSYLIFKGLKAKASFSYGNQGNESEKIVPSTAINPKSSFVSTPSSSSYFGNYSSLNFEPQLTYNGKISDGNISVLVGSTWFKGSSSNRSLDLTGFPGDDFMGSWGFANTVQLKSSSRADERFRSYFGRVNYNWGQKYYLNLSYRRDGSSKFGDNYKWGDFGAVGASWIFSDESFVKEALPFISFGKLRASWGVTGNDQIADYQYLNLYSADNVNYGTAIGLNTQYLYNEDIHWEQTKKLEAALEFGLFKSRISGSVSWYRNRTTDFLVSEPITSQTGFSSFVNNFDGTVQNTGWEFELRTSNVLTKHFQWRTNVNFTIAKNSLYKYDDLAGSAYADIYEIGKPLDIIRRFYVDSISTTTGYAKFRDVNKDGSLTSPGDLVTLGSPSPKNYGGMENIFNYKGFEFSFSVTCANQMVSNWFMGSSLPGRARNLPVQVLGNYWQKPGDQATYPRATSGLVSNTNIMQLTYANISNLAYNDILWFRLNNVSVTYTLPSNWVEKAGLSRASVYARGQNLMFYSPIDLGKDPQAQSASNGTPIKSWVFGVQLSF